MKTLNRISMMLSAVMALALLAAIILSYPAKSAEAALLTSSGETIAAPKTALLPTDSVIGDVPPAQANPDNTANANQKSNHACPARQRKRILHVESPR